MSTHKAFAVLVALVALTPALGACAGILGIDKAEHDEKLDKPATGTGGSGGTDSDALPKTLCDRYCDAVLANCSAENALYTSRDVCMGVCNTFEPGTEGDDGVNTAQCRLRFAQLAGTVGELSLNCPAAGPGGDGHCGTNCEGFCTIGVAACTASKLITVDSCAGMCARLPDPGGFTDKIQAGNSVQCRLYHASAATFDPTTHCPHVAGFGPCAVNSTP
jgi:hypothetical protein